MARKSDSKATRKGASTTSNKRSAAALAQRPPTMTEPRDPSTMSLSERIAAGVTGIVPPARERQKMATQARREAARNEAALDQAPQSPTPEEETSEPTRSRAARKAAPARAKKAASAKKIGGRTPAQAKAAPTPAPAKRTKKAAAPKKAAAAKSTPRPSRREAPAPEPTPRAERRTTQAATSPGRPAAPAPQAAPTRGRRAAAATAPAATPTRIARRNKTAPDVLHTADPARQQERLGAYAQVIHAEMKRSKITEKQLAAATELPPELLHEVLQGSETPSANVQWIIANALGTQPSIILDRVTALVPIAASEGAVRTFGPLDRMPLTTPRGDGMVEIIFPTAIVTTPAHADAIMKSVREALNPADEDPSIPPPLGSHGGKSGHRTPT